DRERETMTHQLKRAGVGLVLLVVLVGLGCGTPPPNRHKFNQILAEQLQKLAEAGNELRKVLIPPQELKSELKDVKDRYQICVSTLQSVKTTVDYLTPPAFSNNAVKLKEEFQNFLKAEDEILPHLKNLVDIFEKNPNSKAAKAAMDPEFKIIKDIEDKAM